MNLHAIALETFPVLGQAARLDRERSLASRPGCSFVRTTGGDVRVRHAPAEAGPRLLFAADGPNVIEHYDALLEALAGRADVVVFEPPGTGGSAPARGFDFSVDAFTRVCGEVLTAVGPRTLIFPCYLGVVGQALARARPHDVTRLVTPQGSSWQDLQRWADLVDARRALRTPVVGQLLLATGRRRIARGWYDASTGDKRFRAPFTKAANEAFAAGGCFCLASVMQGFGGSPAPEQAPVPVPAAVVWGARDRSHKHSSFATALPGAEVVCFEACGHSPELEDPRGFLQWLLTWHTS